MNRTPIHAARRRAQTWPHRTIRRSIMRTPFIAPFLGAVAIVGIVFVTIAAIGAPRPSHRATHEMVRVFSPSDREIIRALRDYVLQLPKEDAR